MISQFPIVAPSSGSGKATVSRGLVALLIKKRLKVQPSKCGPDYTDTKYRTAVYGCPPINLDTLVVSIEHVGELYARYTTGAGTRIMKGMMGMHDGYDRNRGSSAEIARPLNLPVILVVDAKSAAYSMVPLLSDFPHFRPKIKIAGVIFNRVRSPRHYGTLREVCSELGIPCLGHLPKRENLVQKSYYLGLDFSRSGGTDVLERLTALIETHIDYTHLLEETMLPTPIPSTSNTPRQGDLRVSVTCGAKSSSFIYQEHLDILCRLETVTFFSPEHNRPLPEGINLLYLPGGYPEKCHTRLSQAWRRMQSVRNYVETGGRVFAECGGIIYLSKGTLLGQLEHPGIATRLQTGVSPFYISSRKTDKHLTLGCRSFDYNGQHLHGHEFHYTQSKLKTEELSESVTQICNAKGIPIGAPVSRYKNMIASYTRLHWGKIDLLRLFEQ